VNDETKSALEAMAVECDNMAKAAKAGWVAETRRGNYGPSQFFSGERNAWIQAAEKLREKAKA